MTGEDFVIRERADEAQMSERRTKLVAKTRKRKVGGMDDVSE